MSSAVWELQQSVHAALSADAGLYALLGAASIYDDAPQAPTFPYVTLAAFSSRDWATGTEPGTEITFSIHAWSRGSGHKQAHLIAHAVRTALHDAPLALTSHHLVNLRHETSETRREHDGDTYRVISRFRAVLEPTAPA